MNLLLLWPARDPDEPSLWRDLKSGDAGWVPRVGLSLAAAGGLFGAAFLFMGLLDESVGVRDPHIAVTVGVTGAAWCLALILIWATFSRWWRVLKTMFSILAVWVVAVPTAFLADTILNRADFFIASILALAFGATVFFIFTASYRRGGGKALALRDGVIDVRCPECGYSMVGLSQCNCPECGANLTIDELIRRQNYRAISPHRAALPAAEPKRVEEGAAMEKPESEVAVEPTASLPHAGTATS